MAAPEHHAGPARSRGAAPPGADATRLEEELAAARAEIDRLRREKQTAEQLADSRSRWLAHVSHELRTPMNGIIGMTDMTLESELTAQQREQLALVRRSADSLLTLVNDILDHTKISSKKLEIEAISFNLRDAVTDVMATLSAAHRGHGGVSLETVISPDAPSRLIGDPGRLRQVIVNLVGNAVKFTKEGSVSLEVTRMGSDGDEVVMRFAVRDTGIGIAADKIQSIFEPYQQATTATTREFGGTGLGLAICRQLVELMGGRIEVDSQVGVGTVFSFTAAMRLAPTDDGPSPDSVDLAGIRVLVLSDSHVNDHALVRVLEDERLGALVVENIDEALTYIGKARQAGRPIDLLVLDLQAAGLEIAAALLERGIGDTRVLLVTPAGQRGDAARCRLLGIAAYLTGSLSADELAEALRAVAAGTPDLVTRHWLREQRRPLRVLLADDSSTNRLLTSRILERHGHSVRCVNDGAAAVAAHAEAEFDVVLLDVEMPVMDGPSAAQEMRRAIGERAAVPIVALTGHVAAEDRERFLAAGIDEVLPKPVQADALVSLLQEVAGPNGR